MNTFVHILRQKGLHKDGRRKENLDCDVFEQRELDLRELRAKTAPKVFQVWAILSVLSKVRSVPILQLGVLQYPNVS